MKRQRKIFFVIFAFCIYIIFADFLTPFDPFNSIDKQNLSALPPFSKAYVFRLKDRSQVVALDFHTDENFLYIKQRFGEIKIEIQQLESKEPTMLFFLCGTDNLGRDILSRTIYGGKVSLTVALLASMMAFIFGSLVGAFAGGLGGIVDSILMRLTDIFLAFPKLFFILIIVTFLPGHSIFELAIILASINWMGIARLVRSEFLKIREKEFILVLESIGFPPFRIALKHILPNAISPAIVASVLMLADIILTESVLSFLGFGVQPPIPTWGNMISEAEKNLLSTWWLPIPPGILISITVLIANIITEKG